MISNKTTEGRIISTKIIPGNKIQGKNAKELDQFFTKPEIAENLIKKLDQMFIFDNFDCILEPSAGSGSFYDLLPKEKRIGIDIDATPFSPYIKRDFLKINPRELIKMDNPDKVLVIGNPPFGKNAAKALQFLNHATKFSNIICFILPKTFNKISIQNRVVLDFSIIYNEELPNNSFFVHGEDGNIQEYDVSCSFQIWKKNGNSSNKNNNQNNS